MRADTDYGSLTMDSIKATLEQVYRPRPEPPRMVSPDTFDMMVVKGYMNEDGSYKDKPKDAPSEWFLKAYCDLNRWDIFGQFTEEERRQLNDYRARRSVDKWLADYARDEKPTYFRQSVAVIADASLWPAPQEEEA